MVLWIKNLVGWCALHKKLVGAVLACIFALGVLFWVFKTYDTWSFNRGQNKKKEAVNTALQEIANVQTNIAREKQVEQDLIANIKRDSQEHQDSIGATDAQREEVNKSIKRMEEARHSNRNVTEEDLNRILEGLQ